MRHIAFLGILAYLFLGGSKKPKITDLPNWLNQVLKQDVPQEVVAFCFNIYDDGEGKWSIELVGTDRFDADDGDWACSEVTDFGTREKPFSFEESSDWETVLFATGAILNRYLLTGKRADVLKSKKAVAVGFVDGDLTVIYTD